MIFRRKLARKQARCDPNTLVNIVADGAIATGLVGDGRMFPLVILDAGHRPELSEYIARKHELGTGDVRVQWGVLLDRKSTIVLALAFQRPMEMEVGILFDLNRHHGVLIEQILTTSGLYIQTGVEGDRIATTMDQPRMLMEVPDTGYRKIWDPLYLKFTAEKLQSMGMDRASAKRAAPEAVELLRKTAEFRMQGK